MYQHFCKIYDLATNQSKYPKWKKFTLDQAYLLGVEPKKLFDVACGTCSNSILFAREGIPVIGIDQSQGMLEVANNKFAREGLKAKLYKQSFYKIDIEDMCNLAICYDFSTNHILNGKLFVRFLNNIYRCLDEGGIFIFDIKPRADWVKKFLKYSDFLELDKKYSYRWSVEFDDGDQSLVNARFFLKERDDSGKVREFAENNFERVYGIDDVKHFISRTKFKLVSIYDNFQKEKPTADSELWVFVLQK